EPPLGDATAAFLEKIGKNSFIDYGNVCGRIGNCEPNRQSIGIAFQGSVLNQPTDAKRLVDRSFFRRDLCRTEEEDKVVAERAKHQPTGGGDCCQARAHKDNSLMTSFHDL